MKKKIIIGSRGSKLALIYAEKAKVELLKNEEIQSIEIKSITTTGDTITNVRVSDHGGKGLFCKTIEQELLSKNIDLAVHALKDMPTDETEELLTNCFLERNNPREVLISNGNKNINDLKPNAVVGTSSFRREFQLKNIREDLNYKLIRGNVDTRIKKLNDNLYDAIILSYAGIKSLGLETKISQIFSTSKIIPSAGQGVIALQCRKNDQQLIEVLNKVNHKPTHNCIKAERNVLKVLEGNCETAVGAFAEISENKIELVAELFSLDGKQRFYLKFSKDLKLASELGKEVGEILKKQSNNSYKK
jgi:hydroxymethylbilane synthase